MTAPARPDSASPDSPRPDSPRPDSPRPNSPGPNSPGPGAAFALTGGLPEGTTVLEASAGTGKTYTIAALVVRYVAEGVARLDQMLIVTFSRLATGELRERVRERLTTTEAALADPAGARAGDDPVAALLADAHDAVVDERRARLTAALRSFDAATIATTHQFCRQVLAGLGVGAELAGGFAFVESLDDLVEQVLQDLYVRKFAPEQPAGAPRPLPIKQARAVARTAAVREKHARLEPQSAAADSPAGIRVRLGVAVRSELRRRQRARGIRSYDDLQTDLAEVLADPVSGPAARARLREAYRVVLIDEFQDTDPVQWEIVAGAFVGQTRLVLIGDPKQAIYRFRGAEINAYLHAVREADELRTLASNWRSEQRLLDAFDALFAGCTLGDPLIAYRPVRAAHPEPMLRGAGAALRLRRVGRESTRPVSGRGLLLTAGLRADVAGDVASDIVRLLESGAEVSARPDPADRPAAAGKSWRPVQPGDVAVLVRKNDEAARIREALLVRDVPAVTSGSSSVFATPVAQEWLVLLEALEQPHRGGRVRAAALTAFLGWSATDLAAAASKRTDELSALIRSWALTLGSRGVAALLELITVTQELPARVLAAADGERRMTDLRHVGEILHGVATTEGFGVSALVAWLRKRIVDAAEPGEGQPERTRRLDSDADAVQVMTIHASKGLEFPIVYVPYAWDLNVPDTIAQPSYHDDTGVRVVDVGAGALGHDPALLSDGVARAQREEAAEQLRLLYVALTRARSQVVLWWAPATTARHAPLSRLLFGRAGAGAQTAESVAVTEPDMMIAVPTDEGAQQRFEELAGACGGALQVEQVGSSTAAPWARERSDPGVLEVARLDRELDLAWRRTSYTALTAAAHDLGLSVLAVSSEPEVDPLQDEPEEPPLFGAVEGMGADSPGSETAGPAGAGLEMVSPMAGLPGGTAFGSLVHGVFETVDTRSTDLAGEIAVRVHEQLSRWGPAGAGRSVLDPEVLAAALLQVYDTPLGVPGGPLQGLRLRDIHPRDRLSELGFELPLAGGDRPGGALTLGDLSPLITRHLGAGILAAPAAETAAAHNQLLAGYGARLADPVLRDQPLRGFLNGSLDAVLRVRDPVSDEPRFVIVDYKSNWLGAAAPGSGELRARDYQPAHLAASMLSSDYPLQALLYAVALHRYLRWRLPGYAPERHLGGALYLYVRGMCGPDTPVVGGSPCGVFTWSPPPQLIADLSDLLDGTNPRFAEAAGR